METRQLGNSDLHITPIAWTLRRPDQVDGIIDGGTLKLDDEDLAAIEAVAR
jgi:hypothetical protein